MKNSDVEKRIFYGGCIIENSMATGSPYAFLCLMRVFILDGWRMMHVQVILLSRTVRFIR